MLTAHQDGCLELVPADHEWHITHRFTNTPTLEEASDPLGSGEVLVRETQSNILELLHNCPQHLHTR